MPFNVADFLSTIQSFNGIAQTSKFEVNIFPGNGWHWQTNNLFQNLTFLCRATTLPGMNIDTGQIKRFTTSYNIPYALSNVNFGQSSFVFMLDSKGMTQTFFKNWMDAIVVPENDTGGINADTYRVAYVDDYVAQVSISHYDVSDTLIAEYDLYDAFPVSLTPVYMDWNSTNQMAELIVTFAYRNWNMASATSSNSADANPPQNIITQQSTNLPATNQV